MKNYNDKFFWDDLNNKSILGKIYQKYYKNFLEKIYDAYEQKNIVNLKIQNIIDKRAVLFDRKRVFCDNNKSCPSITNKGYKIYWDVGHITEKASEFFCRKD